MCKNTECDSNITGIGNANCSLCIQKSLNKMYGGASSMVVSSQIGAIGATGAAPPIPVTAPTAVTPAPVVPVVPVVGPTTGTAPTTANMPSWIPRKGGNNVGLIAGVIVGVVLFVCCLIWIGAIVFWGLKNKKEYISRPSGVRKIPNEIYTKGGESWWGQP
jgi:hypothetical protein